MAVLAMVQHAIIGTESTFGFWGAVLSWLSRDAQDMHVLHYHRLPWYFSREHHTLSTPSRQGPSAITADPVAESLQLALSAFLCRSGNAPVRLASHGRGKLP